MYAFWVMSGIMFLILDKYKKNNIFLTLAAVSMFNAIFVCKLPEKDFLSVLLFPVFFLIFYLLITRILNFEKQEILKEKSLKDFVGKYATVTKDIGKKFSIDGIGQIEFKNNLWKAKNITDEEIKTGTKVEIVSKENRIINVKVQKS